MSFTYNGVNCETLGMYVESYPNRPFPERKQTVYSVAGRSGDLIVDENAYTNVTQEYDVFVKGGSVSLQDRLSAIAAWLLGHAGYADLTDTYDTSIYRRARVANAVDFLNSLNKYGKATIQFDCEPQRYPATDEVLTTTFSSVAATLTYPSGTGLLPSYPVIEITGKVTNACPKIVAGNLTVDVATPAAMNKIVIDFATQSVYNAYNNQKPLFTSVIGTWDKLGDGSTVTASNQTTNDSMTIKVTTRRYKI